MLRDRLKAAGVHLDPGAGMVLTGGASQLAGVLQRAAFGPREAVSTESLVNGKPRPPSPYDGAPPLVRAWGWLKENL